MNVFPGNYAVLMSVPNWPVILSNWINILYICAGLLLAETLLILVLGWMRHLSWRVRLGALAPLAASVAAVVATRYIDGMYFGGWFVQRSPTPSVQAQIDAGFNDSIHATSVLGWAGIGLTGVLLALGLVGARRMGESRRLSTTPATEL